MTISIVLFALAYVGVADRPLAFLRIDRLTAALLAAVERSFGLW